MGYEDRKKAAERANAINNKARRFHEAGRREQKKILEELESDTGSSRSAEKAIRDAGGGSALGRFFGRSR